jgi:hypothetical protein
VFNGEKQKFLENNSKMKSYFSLYVHRTNQTLDKHVGDSTDSDNEEKEGRISIKFERKTK